MEECGEPEEAGVCFSFLVLLGEEGVPADFSLAESSSAFDATRCLFAGGGSTSFCGSSLCMGCTVISGEMLQQ